MFGKKKKKEGERERTKIGTDEAIFFNFPSGVTESLSLWKSNVCEDLSIKSKRIGRWK